MFDNNNDKIVTVIANLTNICFDSCFVRRSQEGQIKFQGSVSVTQS